MGPEFWGRFRKEDAGAVTVDWVVLTAAVLLMGTLLVAISLAAATDMTTGTGARLGGATVPTVAFP